MIRKLVGGVAKNIGIKFLLSKIRDAAEGKLGPRAKAIYWWLVGVKTWSGLILAGVSVGLEALGYHEWALGLGVAAGVAIQAGVLDKAWRAEIPAWLMQSTLYRFLADNSAGLTSLLAMAFLASQQEAAADPRYGVLAKVVIVAAALGAQLGLVDVAWRTQPPAIPSTVNLDAFEAR